MHRLNWLPALALVALLAGVAHAQADWKPAQGPLMTRWAKEVSPTNALPEYPRPQMARAEWLNLNGLWQYQSGKEGDAIPAGQDLTGKIMVPYPVESALSGVMEHHDRLWYRRSFTVPAAWAGRRLMLNFGAVDYEAEVFVNGQSVGTHTGGYEPFSYDIAPFLKGDGPQELIVRVYDPTDLGGQPRGKQTLEPGGIMYTPTSGIWQTVWLEPVAPSGIESLHMTPDVDRSQIRVTVRATGTTPKSRVIFRIKDQGRVIKTVEMRPNVEAAVTLQKPRLWSPASPALYSVDFALVQDGVESDRVNSYFGMRKISLVQDGGFKKMYLNNKFLFQLGPLDQGFWPDGIYTAPTDGAIKNDISAMKDFGFNMVRKHIKVEPARWYYWTDKLGLLVWQDMPSPNSYSGRHVPIDKEAFEKQLASVITTHWNAPSIIMWVIFNEAQGRHDTARLVGAAKALDPSRLVNRDSGAGNEGPQQDGDVGDVDDVHSYPPPNRPRPSATQALACGEYGGIGFLVKGHTWKATGGGYTDVVNPSDLTETYAEFAARLKDFRDRDGLSAAVYTQITDVETELNGLMTYDRVLKCDPAQIRLANSFDYPLPTYVPVTATAETAPQVWKYTVAAPPADWTAPGFDDSAWKSGPSVFGARVPSDLHIATEWTADNIWMRRTFNPGPLTASQLSQLVLRYIHDDDFDVYINGVLAYKSGGAVHLYENKSISDEARRAIVPNGVNVLAVHCLNRGGDQHVDVGLSLRVPPAGK